jgi:uncharacterized protein YqjF (DUF2071 family)
LAHWSVPFQRLAPWVPLPLETFAGQAWVTAIACELSDGRVRGAFSLGKCRGVLVFTYARAGRSAGLCIIQAQLGSWSWRLACGRGLGLPCRPAHVLLERYGDLVFVDAESNDDLQPFELSGRYGPTGAPSAPQPGSLQSFLLDRFTMVAPNDDHGAKLVELHHAPWALQPASGELRVQGLLPGGIQLPDAPNLVSYCAELELLGWPRVALVEAHYDRPRTLRPPRP